MSIFNYMLNTWFSICGLKNGSGLFKSAKQQKFMLSDAFGDINLGATEAKEVYDIDLLDGQKAILFLGENKFADYGKRGNIPYQKIAILDKNGLVSIYHIGGSGYASNWSPCKDKVKISWKREVGLKVEFEPEIQLPELETEKRVSITGTINKINAYDSQWGIVVKLVVLLADGNKVSISKPKAITEIKENDRITFDCKLEHKDNGFYKGLRPTKAKLI